ncbi:hypothetical protein [Lentzea indica]|uniref:hypothetical protein n=1 Tax=Lentzea indica TaxID=2604800 RepID=UPI0028ABE3CE|nr:hypothetical protein [Lentzea indica]
MAQTPVAVPVEAYGVAATLVGSATGSADETKDIRSSGQPNSIDDRGTVSSNVVTTPTAAAAQVFGTTAGLVGNTASDSSNDTSVVAGSDPKAYGKKSSVSGNIVQVPTSMPAQVFGNGVTAVGNNTSTGDNATDMKAGGDALTTGEDGSIAGNVVSTPVSSGTQVAGWPSAAAATSTPLPPTTSTRSPVAMAPATVTVARSPANLIGAQAAPFVPVPGNSVSAAGITNSDTLTDTNVVAGGNDTSSAEDASVSGNLINVPATAVAGVYADAIAAAGQANTVTEKVSHTQAGGDGQTDGSGPLTARDMSVPVEAAAKVARIPVEVVGQATTQGTSDDTQLTGEDSGTLRATQLKGIQLPKGVDSLMKADEVPAFHGIDSINGIDKLPLNTLPNPADLAAMTGQLPAPALPGVAQERSNVPLNGGTAGITPNVQGLPLGQVLEAAKGLIPAGATERSLPAVPSLPITAPALPVQLPALPTERSLPALPLDGPASVSGLNLNPTQGLAPQAEERALPMNAPALALIDPVNVFERVTGSL